MFIDVETDDLRGEEAPLEDAADDSIGHRDAEAEEEEGMMVVPSTES